MMATTARSRQCFKRWKHSRITNLTRDYFQKRLCFAILQQPTTMAKTTLPAPCHALLRQIPQQQQQQQQRWLALDTEAEFHTVADETLERIQDALDEAMLQDDDDDDDDDDSFESTLASGVLTLSFPPHGTWVLNKQTPNRQIWWSSPLSGPRRYEYSSETQEWIYTRSGASQENDEKKNTLGQALREEIQQLYQIDVEGLNL